MEDEAIPEDIKARAQEFVAWLLSSASGDADPTDALAAALLAVRLAERERCAKFADDVDLKPADGWTYVERDFWDAGQSDASIAIASAIRSQP